MKKSAFTLIELLVVITIIAVLAGIALPVFNIAMEKARATQDANNLKQLGVGFQAYLGDHDDVFFPLNADMKWPETIQSTYVTDWKAFQSPFDKRPAQTSGDVYNVSYGINTYIMNSSSTQGYNDVAKWVSPSYTIIAAPGYSGDPKINTAWTGSSKVDVLTDPTTITVGTHGSGKRINALFGDMHIEQGILLTTFQKKEGTTSADKYRWVPNDNQ